MQGAGFRRAWVWASSALIAFAVGSGSAQANLSDQDPAATTARVRANDDAAPHVTLATLLAAAAATHPLVLGARAETQAGVHDVDAAERRRYPTISAVVESGSGGTSTQASRAIQIEQTLWDGGRGSALVSQAEAALEKSRSRVELQRQQIFLQVVAAWQALLAARDRIAIAESTLTQLGVYEAQMQRRVTANASPQIDLELVVSRLRQTEVDLASARASRRVSVARLEQLSGLRGLVTPQPLPDLPSTVAVGPLADELALVDIDAAARDSQAAHVARGDVAIARAQIEVKSAERWPVAYLRANRPIGSASPYSDNRASVFLGLRYTPGAGFATLAEAESLSARALATEQAVEAAQRDALDAMTSDREELLNARRRMEFLAGAVEGSRRVLESYSRQFTAGRKTWIDLLNAVRELSQSRFAFADAQAAMAGALYRLQIRLGRDLITPQPGIR